MAADLYTDRHVYGVDLDPKRVEVARSRLPGADIEVFNADWWAFPGCRDVFAVGDFDAYAYPYNSFRAWWGATEKADRVAVFFTDGCRMAVNRAPAFTLPDGTKRQRLEELTEKRKLYNFWWRRAVRPWFEAAVAGWTIVKTANYLRKDMIYWGAVIARA